MLVERRDNVLVRFAEAERENGLGVVEGLGLVSLARNRCSPSSTSTVAAPPPRNLGIPTSVMPCARKSALLHAAGCPDRAEVG